MNIGISTCLKHKGSVFEFLETVKHTDFKYIEIWAGSEKYGKTNHFDFESEKDIYELTKEIAKLNLNVHSLHAPFSEKIDISHPEEDERINSVNVIKKCAEILKLLDGNFLVIHPASEPLKLENKSEEIKIRTTQIEKSLNEILEYTTSLGLTIALENQLPHIFGAEPNLLLELISPYPTEKIGLCFDISHASFFKNKTVYDFINILKDRIVTTHIADSDQKNDDHIPLGTGNIDWIKTFETFKSIKYTGMFMLEIIKIPENKNLLDAINESYKFIKNLIKIYEIPST